MSITDLYSPYGYTSSYPIRDALLAVAPETAAIRFAVVETFFPEARDDDHLNLEAIGNAKQIAEEWYVRTVQVGLRDGARQFSTER